MTLLLVHAGATLALAGLIWTIQVVHYPLMDGVGTDGFTRYQERHARAITWIVTPLMFTELGTAGWIALAPPLGVSQALAWFALGLVLVAWGVTALLSVPAHARLSRGFDAAVHRRLVATNWIRTVAWTIRGVVALWMLDAQSG